MEGIPSSNLTCMHCQTSVSETVFRCTDCDSIDILCEKCILDVHRRNGLHNIEVYLSRFIHTHLMLINEQKWDPVGQFFIKSSLRSLGHRYQLGHPIGEACPAPEHAYAGIFTILDINGVHEVNLDFCGCTTQKLHYLQVLRFGWFPATVGIPRTAVTLRLLKFFQILSFESKSTVFEFHQMLQRLSDNTGMLPKKVSMFNYS